tara:strand:- start:254 stop:1042 length:789 start_codon:yes stop_codon:yes gene_type:complete
MFDLVIQGPLDNTSLQHVGNYHTQFKNIIVSHWKEDLTDAVKSNYNKLSDWKIVKGDYGGQYKPLAQITSQPLPDLGNTFGCDKESTFFYSISSTYAGLKKCTSPYVIKMRSDEFYTNFNNLKQRFLKDTKKMVCGNIFFKSWDFKPYHIGDHLFVAEREALLKAYSILFDAYTVKTPDEYVSQASWLKQGEPDTPEQILAKSFLCARGVADRLWPLKETFSKYFDTVDINELGAYEAKWQHGNKVYTRDWEGNGTKFTGIE